MQKTTVIVYPTESLDDWQIGATSNLTLETNPQILVFLTSTDTFVLGSQIKPLNKPAFYQPSVLYL